MITYRIARQDLAQTNTQIRDMGSVLNEIPASLQILLKTLEEHAAALSSPTIDEFRAELKGTLHNIIAQTSALVERVQKLRVVSDQAAKHLEAIEEHFGGVLRDKSDKVEEKANAE